MSRLMMLGKKQEKLAARSESLPYLREALFWVALNYVAVEGINPMHSGLFFLASPLHQVDVIRTFRPTVGVFIWPQFI